MKANPTSSKSTQTSYKVIGASPSRPGETDKVTGKAVFGVDFQLPGLLYGAVLRSPHAHARILSIDTRPAEAMQGVQAVITASDLLDLARSASGSRAEEIPASDLRENCLASRKVLYHGQAVAAVAAADPHLAAEALDKIIVTYEILPPVLDVQQAMLASAPILHPDLRTDESEPQSSIGDLGDRPTNIAAHLQEKHGSLQKGFDQAVVVIEREFHTATVHQGYLEPQNAVARFEADGRLTIWCSTQGSFSARGQVAEVLGIPPERIRVFPQEVGGAFGGKNRIYLEPLAAVLSKKSGGKPVKMVMSHSQVLAATGPTAASYIRVKMGADRFGKITAAAVYLVYAAGAFPGSTYGVAADCILAPYRIPNYQIDAYDVVVNKPWSSSYRGLGTTASAFACETVIDELCEKLGLDALEFRLLNGVQEGDRNSSGIQFERIGFLETLRAARDHPHYAAPLIGEHQGRGVACGYWHNGGGRSSAAACINSDGSIRLSIGSVDITNTRLSLAMQLAETLGIQVDEVQASMTDTDSVGYADGTWGSRTTFSAGWAVYELGQKLIRILSERAARLWEIPVEEVTFTEGVFEAEGQKLSFKELAARMNRESPVTASAEVNPGGVGPAFATHIVDVEVDPETGRVKILRYTAVQDVGKAIHPANVEGQIQGAVTQGIGWGLNEAYFYDEAGHLLNASFLDYRIPTCADVPFIEPVIIEVPNPGHPFGVRGVGEMSIIPPPAAIANAIHAAIGVR